MSTGALSQAATAVLQAVAHGYQHGFDIIGVTGLPSGTVYPVLRRLEHDGLARSQWEPARIAQQEQRPPRRYYVLSAEGESLLEEARNRFPMLSALPTRARPRRA
jgi:DNA-binding PadR family transcriptional regulator